MKRAELKFLIRETIAELNQVPHNDLPQEYKDLAIHLKDLFWKRRIDMANSQAISASIIHYLRKNGWNKK